MLVYIANDGGYTENDIVDRDDDHDDDDESTFFNL